MRILIACESSGRVREAFRVRGHNAVSCDLKPTEIPGDHIEGDVLAVLADGWDMMIGFPPCTHLACCGAKHFKNKIEQQKEAKVFFMKLINAPIKKICIENPVGIMSTEYRQPDQIIQPYYFGDNYQKTTCLWLKNLTKLYYDAGSPWSADNRHKQDRGDFVITPSGKKLPKWFSNNTNPTNRSRTFQGIADAMGTIWGTV